MRNLGLAKRNSWYYLYSWIWECEEAKETPYSKIERLISSNAKELEKARNSLKRYKKISSTSQG